MTSKLDILRKADGEDPVQAAALCTRRKGRRVEVLLITSRDTGRWVLPKGWAMRGKTMAQTAQTEAWEEAGVRGDVAKAPLGTYCYDKVLGPRRSHPCQVEVYPVKVRELAASFPEKKQRRRKWMAAKKAARAVMEPELAAMLRALVKTA